MGPNSKVIFSINSYDYLKKNLIKTGDYEEGEVERKIFPDGERYQRILTNIGRRNVVVIGGTISDEDTLELYDLAYALVKNGALSLTVIMPYFGYSTMERAVKPGEIVTAKTRASLFSSLPQTSQRNRFIFLDLHSEGLPHYFEGAVVPIHVYCKPIILDTAREKGGEDFVLGCTDAGRAKWVESLANDLGVSAAFVFKRRLSGDKTEITSISADVKNKNVVIYDDMIRTGGSLISAGRAYKEAGAEELHVITTHGLFSANALTRIKNENLFKSITCTDTHPNVFQQQSKGLEVKSICNLLHHKLNEI
ncbi:ribose-phosphate diphosphokinase [Fulvivirgaceae bacterium BMA10]|uniref:ribose-phosphate diphosphokinase n=1 Tax=Splendidivirga corallicola TaxID=3051826 RepID=A0ABT8KX65_9BACT|nr:ribose-phosphate diphosphokinase [Fulvivirgaceae bacterium BMA10]